MTGEVTASHFQPTASSATYLFYHAGRINTNFFGLWTQHHELSYQYVWNFKYINYNILDDKTSINIYQPYRMDFSP